MPTKKDVSDWPIDLRLSTFDELSDRISLDLYDRYPESKGYQHDRPVLFRESAYLLTLQKNPQCAGRTMDFASFQPPPMC